MIAFDPNELRRFYSALDRLVGLVASQKNDFPMKCAVDYTYRLSYNITTQKFAPSYAPYSAKYKAWKEKYFPGALGFWRLRDYLLRNIKPSKVSKGWFGGVDEAAIAPAIAGGGSTRIADYGYYMEYGGRRGRGYQPARPLFNPTLDEFESEGWTKLISEVESKMKGAWR